MTTVDLLECDNCNQLRPVTSRLFPRCGAATPTGVCNSKLRRRSRLNPKLAAIEDWVEPDVVTKVAAEIFADSVDRELMRLAFAESFRLLIRDVFAERIPIALQYHRGDHGGDKPMWLYCVIDPEEIRYAIRHDMRRLATK